MVKPRSVNPIDIHVGERIRYRRQQLDMTQTTLGNRLGVTFQQIQKYEKGTNRVGSGRLMQIANLMGVNVTYFYEGAPKVSGSSGAVEPQRTDLADRRERTAHSREGVAVIEALTTMPPKLRKALVEIARTLAG